MNEAQVTPTKIFEGEGPTDVVFTDIGTVNEDLAAMLETSPADKACYNKMLEHGFTSDQALKIVCIMLLIWKQNVSAYAKSQTLQMILPRPALSVAEPEPPSTASPA